MRKSSLCIVLMCLEIWGITQQLLYAQEGFGTQSPSKATVIELKSSQRGMLIPRVELVKTNQFTPPIIGESSTDEAKVNALLVFNTATQNDVTPGFYYWSTADMQWQRLLATPDGQDLQIEPWFVQQTTDQASANTQNIYLMGTVAIQKDSALAGASLDVKGAMVGGEANDTINVGTNSVAYGWAVEASGNNATAIGYGSSAQGDGAFAGGGYVDETDNNHPYPGGQALGVSTLAFGYETVADANYAIALGYKTKALANYGFSVGRDNIVDGTASMAIGRDNQASGSYAVALGRNTQAEGFKAFTMGNFLTAKTQLEAVFGRFNVLFSGNTINAWHPDDPLFVIGNGYKNSEEGEPPHRHNAVTVLKKGWVGIGIDGDDDSAKPTEMLDIGSGNLRVRELPAQLGNSTDSLVVVDENGILKSYPQSALKSTGPWFLQGQNIPAIANTDSIYIKGAVAIGKQEVVHNATDLSYAKLDVQGAIRGGIQHQSGASTQIGQYSIGVGKYVEASGNYTAAFGYKSTASGEGSFAGGGADAEVGGEATGKNAFAFGYHTVASGDYAVAMGTGTHAESNYAVALGHSTEASGNAAVALGQDTKAFGNYSLVAGRYLQAKAAYQTVLGRYNELTTVGSETQWISTDPLFQIGNGSSASNRSNALTILKNGWVGIGVSTPSGSEKLFVNGSISTISSAYPDYVFLKYYTDQESIDFTYQFLSLEQIEAYLKQEHHLPGIPGIEELKKTADGQYIFSLSQLSIKSLEKIEELYLHLIESHHIQHQLAGRIDQLEEENRRLKQRLHRLEVKVSQALQR